MDNQFIPKGMEIVKQAVVADNADDLEKAFNLYKQSFGYFMTGLKYTKNDSAKNAIKEKLSSYMTRAEQIKEILKARQGGSPAAEAGAESDGKGEKDGSSGKGDSKGSGGSGGDGKKDGDGKKKDPKKDPEMAKLEETLSGAIVKEKPNVHWDDVAGLDQAKSLLKEAVILPVKFPQLFTGKRKPWKGILLYGPPGTGKSFLAKAVATEAGASCFLSVSSSDLVSKYQGESERLVKSLFELARRNSPAIIFIDEVDSLCGARGEGENESSRRIKTEFLVQMQGVGKSETGILVLGATNLPWALDPAIRRRFEKRVYIPLPDVRARFHLFRSNVANTPTTLNNEDFEELANMSEGYSGADISVVVRDALYEPVRICQIATHFRKVRDPDGKQPFLFEPCLPSTPGSVAMSLYQIPTEQLCTPFTTMDHFGTALSKSKPTVGTGDLNQFTEWTTQFGQEG